MYVLKITRSKPLRYQLNSNMTLFMRTFFFQSKVKEDLKTGYTSLCSKKPDKNFTE